MLIELRNKGSSARVVYDAHRKAVTVGVGALVQANLPDAAVRSLQQAQALGAKLEITAVEQKKEAPSPAQPLTAADVLERSGSMNYFQLLEAVKKVAPDSGLPQRPTKAQMLALLHTLSPNAST